jgi:hypothetical protein
MLEKLIKCETDVFGDLAEQDGRDVPALMEWNRCAASRGIAELLVRPALADFGETEFDENGDDFIGLEDRNIAHGLRDGDVLNPDEFGLQHRFAVFQQHGDDFVQVMIDFIQRFPLGMSAGKAGNKANKQAGLRTPFNYR